MRGTIQAHFAEPLGKSLWPRERSCTVIVHERPSPWDDSYRAAKQPMCDAAPSPIQLSRTVVNSIEMHDQDRLPRKHSTPIVRVEYVDAVRPVDSVVGSLNELNKSRMTRLTDNE